MLYKEYKGKILFLKVDIDARPKISDEYGVRVLPTVMLFNKGQLTNSWTGNQKTIGFRFAFHDLLK